MKPKQVQIVPFKPLPFVGAAASSCPQSCGRIAAYAQRSKKVSMTSFAAWTWRPGALSCCSIALVWLFVFCFQVQKQELVKAGVYVYQDAKDAARGRVLQHVEIVISTTPANQSHCFSSTGSTKRARDCSSSSEGGENYEVEEAGSAFYRPLSKKQCFAPSTGHVV